MWDIPGRCIGGPCASAANGAHRARRLAKHTRAHSGRSNALEHRDNGVLPFPTAVLADAFPRGVNEATAAAFYGGALAASGLFVNLTWWYPARGHRLLGDHLSPDEARRVGRRFLLGPSTYAVAIVVALVAPWAAVALFLLVNVFYLWPGRVHEEVLARQRRS